MISIDKLDQILDEYETTIGLGRYTLTSNAEIQKYLAMSRQELESLSPEACGEISYILNQYAFYLQRNCNRENARIKWADSILKQFLATEVHNLKTTYYSPYEERLSYAIRNNDYAKKLFDIKVKAQNRFTRINYLPSYIQNIADTLLQIQQTKIRGAKNG